MLSCEVRHRARLRVACKQLHRLEGQNDMANADHLALLLKEGVDAWNAWRVKQASSVPDLSGADLHGVNLHEANFYEANLSGADLSKAYLGGGNLGRATLCGANLREADLSETYLLEANLSGVPRDNQDESSDDQDESDTGSGRREGVARP